MVAVRPARETDPETLCVYPAGGLFAELPVPVWVFCPAGVGVGVCVAGVGEVEVAGAW